MNTRKLILVLVGSLVAGAGLADKAFDAPKPSALVVLLYNGTLIKQAAIEGPIDIETPYGKLSIPAREIRRIEFGFRVPAEVAPRLEQALKQLNSDVFQQREAATAQLVALGRLAYPALLKAAKDKDLETARRVDKILDDIRRKVPGDQLREVEEDCVHTKDAVVKGRIQASVVKAWAEHFGEMQLPVTHVREIWSSAGLTIIAVEPKEALWVDTGVKVTPGTRILIRAAGRTQFDLGDRQVTAGPQGNNDLRNIIDRMVPHNVNLPPGLLLGKLDPDGEEFPIGARYDGVMERPGRLFLRISTGGSKDVTCSGKYHVEIDPDQR